MPMGRVPCSFADFEREGEEDIREVASCSAGPRSSGFAPGPRKPIPPALETATARRGPAIAFIGAPTMKGVVVHGYAESRRAIVRDGILMDLIPSSYAFSVFAVMVRLSLFMPSGEDGERDACGGSAW